MPIEKLFINNQDVKIEVEYFRSSHDQTIGVLLVHPHPQYGGNMQNNVISALYNTFKENDVTSLRFNFRGVGRSTGTHTNGQGETSDVRACVGFMVGDGINKILLCGYSYGSAIACSIISYSEKIIGYCAISFPWDFMGLDYKEKSQTNKPKLFIQGDRDNVALYSNFEKHYKYYLEPKKKVIINGADHFYWGYEHEISREVLAFLKSFNF